MARRYAIQGDLRACPAECRQASDEPVVEILARDEFRAQADELGEKARESIESLLAEESCFVSVFSGFVTGSLAVPAKGSDGNDRRLLAFYCDQTRLLFIEEESLAAEVLGQIAEAHLPVRSTGECLRLFLAQLLADDYPFLASLEDEIEGAEERMIGSRKEVSWGTIAEYRRITVRMSAYYEQLAAMVAVLVANEGGLLSPDEVEGFKTVAGSIERLLRRAESIRDHSLILRELHQTQVDERQNKTMQVLAVATILIAPAELVSGWFGTNFYNLPGVDEPWGVPLAATLVVVVTAFLVFWFRKIRWI